MSFEQLIVDYRTYLLAQSKSPHTIKNFTADLGHCFEFFAATGISTIKNVTSGDIDSFVVLFATKSDGSMKHANTINRMKAALRSFFLWAKRNGHIPDNPAEHVQIKHVEPLPPTYLNEAEEKQLLDCLRDYPRNIHQQRDYAIIRVLLDTGIRVGELAQIELADISDKHLFIKRAKGGNPIRKFLPSITRDAIDQYIQGERKHFATDSNVNALFVNQQYGRMVSRGFQIVVSKWVKRAGILKQVTPHKLRHTFATSLYAKNHDILVVQKALGHRSIVHTQIYAHITDESFEEAMESRTARFN